MGGVCELSMSLSVVDDGQQQKQQQYMEVVMVVRTKNLVHSISYHSKRQVTNKQRPEADWDRVIRFSFFFFLVRFLLRLVACYYLFISGCRVFVELRVTQKESRPESRRLVVLLVTGDVMRCVELRDLVDNPRLHPLAVPPCYIAAGETSTPGRAAKERESQNQRKNSPVCTCTHTHTHGTTTKKTTQETVHISPMPGCVQLFFS